MFNFFSLFFCLFIISCSTKSIKSDAQNDKYLWLEDIESQKSLEFVKNENEKTLSLFKNDPIFKNLEPEIRKIALAKDRLPWVYQMKGELYNFWRDQKSIRGVWRKTTLEEYKKKNPRWETIIDVDQLAIAEKENWVWKGASCLPPRYQHCLITLSRGGKDASVVREFNLKTKSFPKNGFQIPEAKSRVSWIDSNTLYVGTDSGKDSITDSGYPKTIKILKRGQKLDESKIVFEVNKKDLSADASVAFTASRNYHFFSREISFYEAENWLIENGKQFLIPMPKDSTLTGVFKDYLLYILKSELKTKSKTFITGSLVALPVKNIIEERKNLESLELVFAPSDKVFLQNVLTTKNHILLDTLDNIQGKIVNVTFKGKNNWLLSNINLGKNGVAATESSEFNHDQFLASYSDFLTPSSIFVGNANLPHKKLLKLKASPSRFSASDITSEQLLAKSKDGTMIPYFIVHKKNLKKDGSNPTLLYGYGGFEISMQPFYLGTIGKVWAENGGVYVLSNIRGGGEFGPAWHQAAQKENHQKAFDDFIAVAEDLIKNKITSPAHLGIQGGSNGGLLTGATFVERPELFNAVLCEVPLLDMLRYNHLLAGASWMDEYGNPDEPQMREIISKYSPYQNIKKDVHYPEVFFFTSTKDDRVHPGHARKMVAKMREYNHPLFYYENTEGGHAAAANLEQGILKNSLEFTYLWKKLK